MHTPVLLREVLEAFNPQPGQNYIDATVNGGGHATEIYQRVQPKGKVLGIDWDSSLVASLAERTKYWDNFEVVCNSYANITSIAHERKFFPVHGILIDAGFSSHHVDTSGRGFSFTKDEPLDMRYHTSENSTEASEQETAVSIVNSWREEELERIFREYGEERFAGRIAREIVRQRRNSTIRTTFELVAVIRQAIPRQGRGIHFATRVFQAIRIAANHELENLEQGLAGALKILAQNGRLTVISFHSLEDRIVKNFFRAEEKNGKIQVMTKKPIIASSAEIKSNARSRSAKLRVAENI